MVLKLALVNGWLSIMLSSLAIMVAQLVIMLTFLVIMATMLIILLTLLVIMLTSLVIMLTFLIIMPTWVVHIFSLLSIMLNYTNLIFEDFLHTKEWLDLIIFEVGDIQTKRTNKLTRYVYPLYIDHWGFKSTCSANKILANTKAT